MYLRISCRVKYVHRVIELTGIVDIIFIIFIVSIAPADDDSIWLYVEKHPNQIKSRSRCCSELKMF